MMIKTEYASEVTVDWQAVQDFKSDQPLHVGLKNGESVVGPVTANSGKVEVSTKTAGNVDRKGECRSDAQRCRTIGLGKSSAHRIPRRLEPRPYPGVRSHRRE